LLIKKINHNQGATRNVKITNAHSPKWWCIYLWVFDISKHFFACIPYFFSFFLIYSFFLVVVKENVFVFCFFKVKSTSHKKPDYKRSKREPNCKKQSEINIGKWTANISKKRELVKAIVHRQYKTYVESGYFVITLKKILRNEIRKKIPTYLVQSRIYQFTTEHYNARPWRKMLPKERWTTVKGQGGFVSQKNIAMHREIS